MTRSEYVAVAAICATIAGSTWLQSQRITDLRTDVTRQVESLRNDVTRQVENLRNDVDTLRADIREIRQLLVDHLIEHPTND